MSGTTEHFGNGLDLSVFTPRKLGSKGQLRSCIGSNTTSGTRKWYGCYDRRGVTISPNRLSFCEFCGENGFKPIEVFEVTDTNYPGLSSSLVCDSPNTNLVTELVGDHRTVRYCGVKINGNVIDQPDRVWSPILLIPDDSSKSAAESGVLRLPVPSGSYWEFVVQMDDKGRYNSIDYCYKITVETGDGRSIVKMDQSGNSKYYTPYGRQIRINSYNSGEGSRFFFQAPAQVEVDGGIAAGHNLKSNIFKITVTVHTKVDLCSKCTRDVYHSGLCFDCHRQQERENEVRRSGVVFRGSSETRGATRGGVAKGYSGGSNFSTSGYSEHAQTTRVRSRFPVVETINLTLQLVNNESEDERMHVTRIIQGQNDSWREGEIKKREAELERLRIGSVRSEVLSHPEQAVHLI